MAAGRCILEPMVSPHQLDRAGRLAAILVRDGHSCLWCGRRFTGLVRPTTDHLIPRVKGGPSWIENEVAACGRCNGQRGHATPIDWLGECERRGWVPNRDALRAVLDELSRAIDGRGGQRRAAKYLDAQLRRWSNR